MIGTTVRRVDVLPHVRRARLPERALALGAAGGHDQRQLVDRRRTMAGIADEACVLDVRDGLDTHEEIVHVHAVHRPFVFLGIFGTHQELASRNQRELGHQIGRHRYRQEDSACAFSTTLAGMQLETFALERYQSIWENRVTWNLAESGVHPLRVTDLVNTPELQVAMFEQELGYPQTNGTIELRTLIASIYPHSTVEHIEVTNGGSEANCVLLMRLVQPGDRIVFMTPNYLQASGLARALGAEVQPWPLRLIGEGAAARWSADTDELRRLVTPKTRAILLCNPNNPTGARLEDGVLDEVCAIAASAGAWVIGDEIYRGA